MHAALSGRYADTHALETALQEALLAWHEGDGRGQPLHAYLGMSDTEYMGWVDGRQTLDAIVAARRATTS